jgi:hypothetical protein
MEDDQTDGESSYSISPWFPGGVSLSRTQRKPKPWPIVWRLFQLTTIPSVLEVTEMVDMALRSYFLIPASEPKLTNPDEVLKAISGLKVGRAPGPNGILNRALKHLPQRAVSPLFRILNVVLCTHHFPTAWKHARVISIHKPRRIWHCPHPIGPLVCWTRSVNDLKRSY